MTERGFELSPAAVVGRRDGRPPLRTHDLDGAERELERGVELARHTRDVSARVWAYVNLSRTRGRGR